MEYWYFQVKEIPLLHGINKSVCHDTNNVLTIENTIDRPRIKIKQVHFWNVFLAEAKV